MRKLIVLVAAAMLFLPMSAMAGMTAFMDMEKVSDFELAETTGQTGLTVDVDVLGTTFTWVSWGDDDGYNVVGTTLAKLAASGVLYIVPVAALDLDLNLTVDVCTTGGINYLVLEIDNLDFSNAIALGLGDGNGAGHGTALEAGAIAAGPTADKLGILTVDALIDNIVIEISAH